MTTLTLTEILGEPRQWSPKDNPERIFNSYRVKDDKGVVYEINRKASSPPPELGTGEYEVTPAKGDFPPKLKKVFAGGGGRSGAKDAYWEAKEQRDIEGVKRMGRAHAQEMALRYHALVGATSTSTLTLDEVAETADFFQRDVDEAVVGSGLGGGVGQQEPANRAPAVESSASPSRKGQTSKKLNALGVDPETQRQLVHAFAGNPPTEAGLDAIDAALEAQDYATLFDEQGIQRPPFLPDTRDLAPAEVL